MLCSEAFGVHSRPCGQIISGSNVCNGSKAAIRLMSALGWKADSSATGQKSLKRTLTPCLFAHAAMHAMGFDGRAGLRLKNRAALSERSNDAR
jgi:hypothetical protein